MENREMAVAHKKFEDKENLYRLRAKRIRVKKSSFTALMHRGTQAPTVT
jgi:hypothetical protein